MSVPEGGASPLRFYVRAALLALVAAILAYFLTFLFKPRYKADSSLLFPLSATETGVGAAISNLKGGGGDPGSVPLLGPVLASPSVGSNKDTAIGLLKSLSCMRAVVEENDLTAVYHLSERKAIKSLSSRADVSVDKDGLVAIAVTDESPDRAVAIVRSMENFLKSKSDELSVNPARANRIFIEKLYAQANGGLAKMQVQIGASLRARPVGDVDEREKSLVKLQEAASDAKVKADSANAEIAASERSIHRLLALPRTYPNRALQLTELFDGMEDLVSTLHDRQVALEDVYRQYTKGSPEALIAEQKIKAIDATINSIVSADQLQLQKGEEPSLVQAMASAKGLSAAAGEYENVVAQARKGITQDISSYLSQTVDKTRFKDMVDQVDRLYGELQLARIAEERDPSRFEVLDAPSSNGEIVYPRRALTAGVVFALVFAAMLAPLLFTSKRGPADF